MDRAMLLAHLAQAERHVAIGERDITRQRSLIEKLRRDGHDTRAAEKLLATFEQVQRQSLADCERLRIALAEAT